LINTHKPVALVHRSGHLHVVTDFLNHENDAILQCLHGNEGPFLVNRSDLASYRSLWLVPSDCVWPPRVPYSVGSGHIEISKIIHSFGITRPNESYSVEILLRNIGDTPLCVNRHPLTSCGCTVSQVIGPAVIYPGDSCSLRATLKTSNATSISEQLIPEIREVGTSNSIRIPILLCAAQPASLEVTPSHLDFGKVRDGSRTTRSIFLRETDVDRFRIDEASIDVGDLPVQVRISQR